MTTTHLDTAPLDDIPAPLPLPRAPRGLDPITAALRRERPPQPPVGWPTHKHRARSRRRRRGRKLKHGNR